MKISALKTLAVSILVSGIVALGFAAPAHATAAATISVSSFTANTTVSTALNIQYSDTAQSVTDIYINMQYLNIPNSCTTTPTQTFSNCGVFMLMVNNSTPLPGTTIKRDFSPASLKITLPSAVSVTSVRVDFSANQLTVGNGGTHYVIWQVGTSTPQVAYTVTAPSYTVTFKGNGAAESDYTQSGSGNTTLTSNAFTRAGFTFAGWSLAAGGSRVANDAGSYNITSNVDLYARWTAVVSSSSATPSASTSNSAGSGDLAATGSDSAGVIATGAGLVGLGVVALAVLQVVRYRRRNS